MKVNKIDNNTSFGLRAQTHEYITLKTAKEFANLSDDIAQKFAHYVQKPDFDETGLKIFGKDTCNNHFYYFPKTFRTRESHLDFDRKHNAFSRYIDHICNMFTNINYKNKEGVIEERHALNIFLMICPLDSTLNVVQYLKSIKMKKFIKNLKHIFMTIRTNSTKIIQNPISIKTM